MYDIKPMPPHELIARTGVASEWHDNGEKFHQLLIDKCGLNESSNLMDLGSGPGRMWLYCMAHWGDKLSGKYYAQEIDKEHTDWMSANLPKAEILYTNILNKRYNPNGTIDPKSYTFPWPDNEMDVAVLLSVMTHMYEPECRRYSSEIHRMLKPGGRALITCFISEDGGDEGMKTWKKETLEDIFKPLKVVEFVPGDWKGGLSKKYHQDFYILTKE